MSAQPEQYAAPISTGDEALAIINAMRSPDEQLWLREIDHEFPFFGQELGKRGVKLLDLTDNPSGSFKWRGGAVAVAKAYDRGVDHLVVPSAGNHARGVIAAAREYDLRTTIVVPTSAPYKKQQGLYDMWNSSKLRVVPHGGTFDEALRYAYTIDGHLVHPYNDPDVMSGQGTIVDDILELVPDVNTILTTTGGGGQVGGLLQRLDELGRSNIAVHAVEAEGSDSLSRSLVAGEIREATNPNPRFGGTAVKKVGPLNFAICRDNSQLVLHTAPIEEIEPLIDCYDTWRRETLRDTTPAIEPTSFVAIAGLKHVAHLATPDHPLVVLATGANAPLYPDPHSSHRDRYRMPF